MSRTAAHEAFLASFGATLRPEAPPWISELRRKALERFNALGFPTTRQEEWRATNVQPLAAVPFELASLATHAPPPAAVPLEGLARLAGPRLTFFNGRHDPELSRTEDLPPGVVLKPLSRAIAEDGAEIAKHLSRHADWHDHPFTALNTAFLGEGAVVTLARGAVIDRPINLLFVTAAGEEPLVSHPRVLVVAGEGSQATIVETHAGVGRYLANAVTELALGPASMINHVRIQRDSAEATHLATIQSRHERDASLRTFSASFGAALQRCDVRALLAAEGADCALDGLYVGGSAQHLDNHTFVDHASAHCTSRQEYAGILGGRARGFFHGRVLVRKDAQGTDARQSNRNLILSGDALADTRPQLEIHADDVKCTHGATIGQLERDAVFYCRSRGLSEGEAKALLTHAFASRVLERIGHEAVRGEVQDLLAAWLPQVGITEAA